MKTKVAICPGSFDPVTKGHMDIIRRSAKMFDKIYVAVLTNSNKKYTFSTKERMEMMEKCTNDIENVEVCTFSGLLAENAKKYNAVAIVRGLRAVTDFEYEFQLALTNKKINPELETVFLTTNSKYMYLSSSIVKEIAVNGGDITDFVPIEALNDITERLSRKD